MPFPDQSPIAPNPLLFRARIWLFLNIIPLSILLPFGIFAVLRAFHSLGAWVTLGYGLLYLLSCCWQALFFRFIQRVERDRFRAAAREVQQRRTSYASPSFAPMSIVLRLKKSFLFLIVGVIWSTVILLEIPILSGPTDAVFYPMAITLTALMVLSSLAITVLVIRVFLSIHATIEITETGLRTPGQGSLAWQDVQLFACYIPPALLRPQVGVFYEVSSRSRVISWRWMPNPRSPFTLWYPLLPLEEYQQYMQALCDLVDTKTGLPLHVLGERAE